MDRTRARLRPTSGTCETLSNTPGDEPPDHGAQQGMCPAVRQPMNALQAACDDDCIGSRPGGQRRGADGASDSLLDQDSGLALRGDLYCSHQCGHAKCGIRDQNDIDGPWRIDVTAGDHEGVPGPNCIGDADRAKTFEPDRPRLFTIDDELRHGHRRHEANHGHPCPHPHRQSAQIPGRIAPFRRPRTMAGGVCRNLMVEDRARSDDASPPRGGRNDSVHLFQVDDQGPVSYPIADATLSRRHSFHTSLATTRPGRQEGDHSQAASAPQCGSSARCNPPPKHSHGSAAPAVARPT